MQTWATGNNSARGFTLFEMLAVMVLLALFAVLFSSPLQKSLQRNEEIKAVNSLVATLRQAHLRALQSGQVQDVQFDLTRREYTLPGEKKQRWPASMRITLTTAKELGSVCRFFPDGASSGGGVLIQGERRWSITISWLTGAVEMRRLQ